MGHKLPPRVVLLNYAQSFNVIFSAVLPGTTEPVPPPSSTRLSAIHVCVDSIPGAPFIPFLFPSPVQPSSLVRSFTEMARI